MANLDLISSKFCPFGTGHVFSQDTQRFIKDCQPYFSSQGINEEIVSRKLLSNAFTFPWSGSIIQREPVDMTMSMIGHDTMEKYSSGYLRAESDELQRRKIDLYVKPDVTHFTSFPFSNTLDYLNSKFLLKEPFIDFVGDLAHNEKLAILSDGRVLFCAGTTDLKNFLSIVGEMYLNEKNNKLFLVPQFNRFDFRDMPVAANSISAIASTTTVPPISTEKMKVKTSPRRKKSKKTVLERDLYKRSYFHACENFLTLMMNWKYNGNAARLSLIRSGPEVPMMLGQISAGIAGTGLAVLLFVTCKVAYSRVPICESKLLSTGLGFGLVWLAGSVNKLKETMVFLAKNSVKKGMKDEEMIGNVDKRLNEVYLRAAVLMTVAVMKVV